LGNSKGKDHSDELGVDGEYNIRLDLRETGWGDADWMHKAQDRDQWRIVVDTVMNLRVP
jgi:hypothetical protein